MHIRQAIPDDAAALARLCIHLGSPADNELLTSRMIRLCAMADHQIWVACTPTGHLCGWLHIAIVFSLDCGRQALIQGLGVEAPYQGQGTGRKLLQHAEGWIIQQHCSVLLGSADAHQEGRQLFFQAEGFQCQNNQFIYRKSLLRH
ncbi:GNAT family N-acetyltransferase [Pokkaliibacter plantistimulans]|uniref:GNAT family N-acetyltransferase n=1 Tax=Pokkaliibacter plantistimulans TaxID=1635171 RepID=UPI000D747325|nr:GNAT family N-acetyltransferase [Pokkaliibacter plantistimulans]